MGGRCPPSVLVMISMDFSVCSILFWCDWHLRSVTVSTVAPHSFSFARGLSGEKSTASRVQPGDTVAAH